LTLKHPSISWVKYFKFQLFYRFIKLDLFLSD
jgi:hypothetical protein